MIHLAGIDIMYDGCMLIQRCSLCGATLIDVDIRKVACSDRPPTLENYPRWKVGAMVEVIIEDSDSTRHKIVEPESPDKLPDNMCIYVLP